MNFNAGNIYHIYNRGNNKQTIFFKEANYIYFLQKVRKYITPCCDILAYVLMPNHFHLLIHANDETGKPVENNRITTSLMSEGIRLLLSAYSKGVNKQEGRTGNLIQQKTKSKCVADFTNPFEQYGTTCFYYIHQNPLRAGLVAKMEDWHFSSFRDYAGLRNGTLCNQELARKILDIQNEHVTSQRMFSDESLKNIW